MPRNVVHALTADLFRIEDLRPKFRSVRFRLLPSRIQLVQRSLTVGQIAPHLDKAETELAYAFQGLQLGVDLALEREQPLPGPSPVCFGCLGRRWLLQQDDRGRAALDDLPGARVLDLAYHGIALGRLQVEPKTTIVMPPERLLEGGPVLRIAKNGCDQPPGLDRVGRDTIALFICIAGVLWSMDEIADRFEIAQLLGRTFFALK